MLNRSTLIIGVFTLVWPAMASAQQEPDKKDSRSVKTTFMSFNAPEKEILEIVGQRGDFLFEKVPFRDVSNHIRETFGVNLLLHETAVDNGLAYDEEVEVALKNITLRSALRILLETYDCTWTIEDEVLKILSKEESEERLVRAIYDVSDLKIDSSENLASALTTSVYPDSWNLNGGSGSIVTLSANNRKLLIVRQTIEIHDNVHSFLDLLREASSVEAIASGDSSNDEQTVISDASQHHQKTTETPNK